MKVLLALILAAVVGGIALVVILAVGYQDSYNNQQQKRCEAIGGHWVASDDAHPCHAG